MKWWSTFCQVFRADFWHGVALAVLASIDTFCGCTPSQCGHCVRSIVFVRAHFRALGGTRRRSFLHAVGTAVYGGLRCSCPCLVFHRKTVQAARFRSRKMPAPPWHNFVHSNHSQHLFHFAVKWHFYWNINGFFDIIFDKDSIKTRQGVIGS